MLRLPRFEFHAPRETAAALDLLASSAVDTMLIAGGTDLLPNMKRRQQTPRVLVSLRQIAALHRLEIAPDGLTIGACVTLNSLVGHAHIDVAFEQRFANFRERRVQVLFRELALPAQVLERSLQFFC